MDRLWMPSHGTPQSHAHPYPCLIYPISLGGITKKAAGTAAFFFYTVCSLRRDDGVRDLPHRVPRGQVQSAQER